MSGPPLSKSTSSSTRDLKNRVLTCVQKLSDRDTHSAAAHELEAIAKTLPPSALPSFLSSISLPHYPSDKSPVRTQCIRLISLLSASHPPSSLSPHLSKLLSPVLRRLRDPDSSVRLACVHAASSISSHVTKPPFTSIVKPFVETLVTEQDCNGQIGAALCVAAVIDAAPDPDRVYLRKVVVPRVEKLLRSNSNGFKAKAALLTIVGSVVEVGAVEGGEMVRSLVRCLVGFLGSEDWAVRKAAAEALLKLAVVEEGGLVVEFKAGCLKTFEARKYDKVKVVRETMNQLVEAWKGIADFEDGAATSPPEPQSSSKDNANDEQYPPGSKTSQTFTSGAPQMRKKNIPGNRSASQNGSVSTTTARISSLGTGDKKSGTAMFRKLDCKKPTDWKIEISAPHSPSTTVVCEDGPRDRTEKGIERSEKLRPSEARRALFNRNADDKMFKFGGVKAGSQVVPCEVDNSESAVEVSEITENICKNQKESEDLSLIRKKLVQIENQQSSLLDLLQNFIGSSQSGMHSLETRVQGFELALNEISYDLALTNGRMSNMDSKRTSCCSLPGAEFLSPKFWRRTEPRHSISRFSSSRATPSMAAICNLGNRNGNAETFKLESRRFQGQGSGGFIVNPLAEIHSDSHGITEISSNGVSKNVQNAS